MSLTAVSQASHAPKARHGPPVVTRALGWIRREADHRRNDRARQHQPLVKAGEPVTQCRGDHGCVIAAGLGPALLSQTAAKAAVVAKGAEGLGQGILVTT